MSTILLIEDDAALADVLAVGLEDAGYVVLQARDGVAGLACITRDQPAVVVSDVNMPRLDGFTLCRRLRASNPSSARTSAFCDRHLMRCSWAVCCDNPPLDPP